MNTDEAGLLQRIAQRLDDHVDRYDRDRLEERDDRRKWRDEIQQDVKAVASRIETVEESIQPVVNDHQTVMRVIKWTGAGGTVTVLAWGWNYLKEHLKP